MPCISNNVHHYLHIILKLRLCTELCRCPLALVRVTAGTVILQSVGVSNPIYLHIKLSDLISVAVSRFR